MSHRFSNFISYSEGIKYGDLMTYFRTEDYYQIDIRRTSPSHSRRLEISENHNGLHLEFIGDLITMACHKRNDVLHGEGIFYNINEINNPGYRAIFVNGFVISEKHSLEQFTDEEHFLLSIRYGNMPKITQQKINELKNKADSCMLELEKFKNNQIALNKHRSINKHFRTHIYKPHQ